MDFEGTQKAAEDILNPSGRTLMSYVHDVAILLTRPGAPTEPIEAMLVEELAPVLADGALPPAGDQDRYTGTMLLSVEDTDRCNAVLAPWVLRKLPFADIMHALIIQSPFRPALPSVERFASCLRAALLTIYESEIRRAFEDAVACPPDPHIRAPRRTLRERARQKGRAIWGRIPNTESDTFWNRFRQWFPEWFWQSRLVLPLLQEVAESSSEEREQRVRLGERIDELVYFRAVPEFLPSGEERGQRQTDAHEDVGSIAPGRLRNLAKLAFHVLPPDELLADTEMLMALNAALEECAKALPERQRLIWLLVMFPAILNIDSLKDLIDKACEEIATENNPTNRVKAILQEAAVGDGNELWTLHNTDVKRFRAEFIADLMGHRIGTDGINSNHTRAKVRMDWCVRQKLLQVGALS